MCNEVIEVKVHVSDIAGSVIGKDQATVWIDKRQVSMSLNEHCFWEEARWKLTTTAAQSYFATIRHWQDAITKEIEVMNTGKSD